MPRPNVEAERREQILDATCAVIAEAGLGSLRVSDVAKTAGVSTGTVHYYFVSKNDLVNAAFEFNFSNSLQRRQWLLYSNEDPVSLLRHIVDSYLPGEDGTTLRAWRVWADLWAEGMRDPTLQEINERLYGQWRDLVANVISKAQDQQLARPGSPGQLADMLIAMIDGLAMQSLLHSSHMTQQTMRQTCRVFIDETIGLGAETA